MKSRPHNRWMIAAGVLTSVVVVEPAPIDLLLVALCTYWMVLERLRVPASAVVLGTTYVGLSVLSQLLGASDNYLPDARIVRDIAIEGYLVFVLVVLCARFMTHPEAMRSFFTGMVAGAVLVASAFFILRVLGRVPTVMWRDEFRVRVRGLFKDPNVLGPFLILPVLLLLFRNEIVRLPFARLAALPCIGLLGLTYSRGAYIGFLVAIAVAGLMLAGRERVTYRTCATALVIFAMAIIAARISLDSVSPESLGVDTGRLSYQSYDDHRFSTLGQAYDYVVANPFGNGVHAFARTYGSNPHNLFLGKATDAGIVAALIAVSVPVVAAVRVAAVRTRFATLLCASLVGNLAVSSVIYSHHWRHIFFLCAAAFAVSARDRAASRTPVLDLRPHALDHRSAFHSQPSSTAGG